MIDSPAEHDDLVLVAAGTGPDVKGWLFAIEGWHVPQAVVEELDQLNTSGLAVVDDRLYRVLSSPSTAHASGDFLVYDRTGVVTYRRVDGLADSHGLAWTGTHFVVPCSYTNDIFWLTTAGETHRVWHAPGEGDAWHVNGVHVRGERLYATAFGVFATHRGWSSSIGGRTGIIFDVESQSPIVEGLACPHDPMFIDQAWLVCDSFTHRVLAVDESTRVVARQAQLTGWTRGMTVGRGRIVVGVSGNRHGSDKETRARLAVLDRATLDILFEIDLPCQEITTVALVPRSLVEGLRRGFRTNDLRVGVQDRRDLFEQAGNVIRMDIGTPMDPLEKAKDRVLRVGVGVPPVVTAGRYFNAEIRIENRGSKTLFSAPPFPINVGITFTSLDSGVVEERRASLPEPIPPGAKLRFTLPIVSPATPGAYEAKFTLLQEWVRWFDTDRPRNARIVRLNVI